MKAELSTNVVRIDLSVIHANILNREWWDRKWVIFDYDNVVVTLSLSNIDVRNGAWYLRVQVKDNNNSDPWSNTQSALESSRIDEPDLKQFQKKIIGAVHEQIRYHERRYGINTAGYDALKEQERELEQASKDKLRKYCEDQGIEDESIIDVYVSSEYETFNLTSEYVSSFENNYMLNIHNQFNAMVEFI